MQEKTDIQKLAELFKRVETLDDDTDGRAVDLAVGLKLADMVKKNAEVLAAVTGDAVENPDGSFGMQLVIAPYEGNNYFMIFPDIETAAAMGVGYTMCRLEELLRLVEKTPQMKGLQLIMDYEPVTRRIYSGQINRRMAAMAVNMQNEG